MLSHKNIYRICGLHPALGNIISLHVSLNSLCTSIFMFSRPTAVHSSQTCISDYSLVRSQARTRRLSAAKSKRIGMKLFIHSHPRLKIKRPATNQRYDVTKVWGGKNTPLETRFSVASHLHLLQFYILSLNVIKTGWWMSETFILVVENWGLSFIIHWTPM